MVPHVSSIRGKAKIVRSSSTGTPRYWQPSRSPCQRHAYAIKSPSPICVAAKSLASTMKKTTSEVLLLVALLMLIIAIAPNVEGLTLTSLLP